MSHRAEGIMVAPRTGAARFERGSLRPLLALAPRANRERARALDGEAHRRCFVANSVNFAVEHAPEFVEG
jgi:organic hydroperoxide reductase OsmC/OhrA